MTKSRTWVIVANSSFAEIYSIEPGRDIHKIRYIDFPDARKRSGEINSERSGRSHESIGSSRHALGKRVDAHTHEMQIFAHDLAHLVNHEQTEHAFDKLALICPPHFLGELRPLLSEAVKKCVYKEINKDLPAALSEQERLDHLCKLLEIKRPVSSSKA